MKKQTLILLCSLLRIQKDKIRKVMMVAASAEEMVQMVRRVEGYVKNQEWVREYEWMKR